MQPRHFGIIHAYGVRDYTIRPTNPCTLLGGPPIRLLTEDPRLKDDDLQEIPGLDGDRYDPPKRFQLLELDQSWIIAESFTIE